MAIVKKVFQKTNVSAAEATAEMLSWLQNNASDYFTSIISGDNNSIICKLGEVEALILYPSATSSYKTTINLRANVTSQFYAAQKFPTAYKTNKGIVLFDTDHIPIFIIKDAITERTLIFIANCNLSSNRWKYSGFDILNGSAEYVIAQSISSNTYLGLKQSATKEAGATALCPIIFGSTGAFSEGFFIALFNQNATATETVIKIGTKQYVFDGAVALEE